MPSLTADQVRHIAKLARLKLSEEEVKKFSTELTQILGYIDILNEVPTDDVAPTAQVTGLLNQFREDVVSSNGPSGDALLATSPLPIVDHQIETPSAHG
ncbi:MAG: Asp-tRNA(Asn)/Glu-tRNA(Gln) amidotransferase subunit GatC [Candidatus Peregrinibacteria bacterium]|nr:Asp-tRNA(Asn)/Glu-tRNA(Gln) amidotransferase subunit GatC [Candidatus Peregrinibacteria bacterium]